MTENHEYGPDIKDLNTGIHEETEEGMLPDVKRRVKDLDGEFYQKIRQDTPPDSNLSEFVDLESEHKRKYDND